MRKTSPAVATAEPVGASGCLNCGEILRGRFCGACGQEAIDLRRPFRALVSDAVDGLFSLDTRLLRTLRPLLFKPGLLTREYIAGHRVRHVQPLKMYLIAALLFFGLFAVLPSPNVTVEITPEGIQTSRNVAPGSGVRFSIPERFPIYNARLQAAAARAKANPNAFSTAFAANVPRAFFLLLPMFALLLELFYRREYYVNHLVFSLYYHAFVFLILTVFVVLRTQFRLPWMVGFPLGLLLLGWVVAYLPIALRRVYGESRTKTFVKLVGLGVLYLVVFGLTVPLAMLVTLSMF